MNKFTRLTALLLAMLMIFSTVASAETAYKVEDMTVDNWQSIVNSATEKLFTVEEGDSGKTVTPPPATTPAPGAYYPYADGVTVELGAALVEAPLQITESGVAVLQNADAGRWQMQIDGEWIGITGATGSELWVTSAMMNGMISADFRKGLGDRNAETGEYSAYTAVATVEIVAEVASHLLMMAREGDAAPTPTPPAAANDVLTVEDANKSISLVVQYVRRNEPLADPYTATFVQGASFTSTVMHPDITGYVPQYSSVTANTGVTVTTVMDGDEEVGVTYSFTELQKDATEPVNIVITVEYLPDEVTYTVKHWQQNVLNDNYNDGTTPYETETFTGYTESMTTAAAKDYGTGFYALLFEQKEIAADGTTVINIYYNRYYYLLSFELDGGYGVEPVYARYGSDLPEIGTPIKPGYTFKGWASSKTLADAGTVDVQQLPPTMPAAHTPYYAVWEMDAEAKVNIVFWGENPDDENYSYIQTGEVMADSGSSYTYTHGTRVYMLCDLEEHEHGVDCTLTCGKEEHTTHTDECFKCGHTHTLTTCYHINGSGNYTYDLRTCERPDDYEGGMPDNGSLITVYPYAEYGYTDYAEYYVYLDNEWYCAWRKSNNSSNWSQRAQTEIVDTCSHNHTSECYGCEVHEHTTSCFSCDQIEHTHDNSCNQEIVGLDTTLWQFVRSETATVNPDGSTTINVYYDRTEFTLHFRKKNSNQDDYGTIKAKWGSNIEDEFDEVCDKAGYQSWSENKDASSPWTNYIAIMPKKDMTYYSYTGSGNYQWVMTYYKETFAKGEYEVAFTVTLYRSGNTTVSKEEFLELEGFTFNEDKSTKTGSSTNGAKFYYDRNTYNIEFYNPNELIKKVTGIHYQASIADQGFTPGAEWIPAQYEPGSVEFAGWYLNPECTGEQYTFEGQTMPVAPNNGDTSLVLYAKWTEKTYTVRFFLTEADLAAGNVYDADDKVVDGMPMVIPKAEYLNVPHGSRLGDNFVVNHLDRDAMIAANPRVPYTFDVWYYYDEAGNKQVFTPDMQIKGNLDLIAAWIADVLIPYRVRYVYMDGETEIAIADDLVNSALAGGSETFVAKIGDELYAADDPNNTTGVNYQSGYYPTLTNSHNVQMEITYTDKEQTQVAEVVYTFYYYKKDAVPYTVYYLAETLKDGEDATKYTTHIYDGKTYYIIADTKPVSNNQDAVVYESFKAVSGYMPDAYQKQLILSSVDANNVIRFFYTVDSVNAIYKLSHHFMNLDGTTYTETASEQPIGTIGKPITATPMATVPEGFEYNSSKTEIVVGETVTLGTSAVLTDEGLEIKHYYDRKSYPYTVHYYLIDTTTQLHADKTESAVLYGTRVTEQYVDLSPAYRLVSAQEQTLTIGTGDNTIIFYYEEQPVMISYAVVGVGGTVSKPYERLDAVSGTAEGSIAAADPNYKFVGWFVDAECTIPVTEEDGTITDVNNGVQFVPAKEDATDLLPAHYVNATFYALFELDVADLTIKKVVEPSADGTAAPAGEVFTLEVDLPNGSYPYSNSNGTTGTLKVVDGKGKLAIKADETITITGIVIGSAYTVAEINVPTYFKASEAVSGTIAASGNTATITNTYLTGSLTVKKAVVGATAPDDAFNFTVKLGNETQTFALKAGEENTITGIPAGTAYTVTEEANSKYTTTKTGDTGTIASGETAEAVFTNTYMYGDLKIGKRVEPEESADKKQTFEFTLELSDTETAYQYIITDDKNVQQSTGTIQSGGTFQLQDEWHILVKDLPGDTTYTVTETQIPGYATYVSVDGTVDGATGNTHISTGTIEAGEERVTRFVNVYGLGAINIIKDVVGTDAPDDTFYFTLEVKDSNGNPLDGIFSLLTTYEDEKDAQVTKTDNVNVGAPIDFTLNAGWSALISGLPEGTQYTITETEHADYDTWVKTKKVETAADETSYGDKTYVATGVIPAKGMKQVIYTNVYQYSHLTVRKEGMEAGESAIFQVTAHSKYNKDQQTTFTVSVPNGKSVTIGELLIGSDYTITEVGSWSNRYPQATTETGTIQQNGSEVTITNTGKNQQWLHGEDYVHNDFSKPGAYGN